RVEQRLCKSSDARRVESPVVEVHLLRLTAHHKMQRETLEVAILQCLQLLQAHDTRGTRISIEQNEAIAPMRREQRASDAQHRGDTAARGKADVSVTVAEARREAAVWRQHVDLIADPQVV